MMLVAVNAAAKQPGHVTKNFSNTVLGWLRKFQNVTQAMIDAQRDLSIIYVTTGGKSAELLIALTQPQEGVLTRWRDTVAKVTGEKDEDVHAAMIRSACENLAAAWQGFDYRARERKAKAA